MKTVAALVLLLSCSFGAPLDPRALVLEVSQSQSQEKEFTMKRSTGEHDFRVDRRRHLRIICKALGNATYPVTIRWYFIGKEGLNNRSNVWSRGERVVDLNRVGVNFVADSSELSTEQSNRPEGVVTYRHKSGTLPHGWAVAVYQGDRLVKVAESSQGLLARALKGTPSQ